MDNYLYYEFPHLSKANLKQFVLYFLFKSNEECKKVNILLTHKVVYDKIITELEFLREFNNLLLRGEI